jgi:hypothetical protein
VAEKCFVGGNTTELQLHTKEQKFTLNRSPSWSLTLREKVYVMQQINLFLGNMADAGESGLRDPLLR